jgi:hypothetical protein
MGDLADYLGQPYISRPYMGWAGARNVSPEEAEAIRKYNAEWLRPCTPEQQRRHDEQCRNASPMKDSP